VSSEAHPDTHASPSQTHDMSAEHSSVVLANSQGDLHWCPSEEYAGAAGYYLVRLGFDGYALLGSKTGTTSTESWTVLTPDGELVPASQSFEAGAMRAHPTSRAW
jgi:hypothetical protein